MQPSNLIATRQIQVDAVGQVPDTWRIASVAQLVKEGAFDKIQDGNHGESHPVASDYTESGIPFIMSNCIRNGRVDYSDCKFLSPEHAESLRVGHAQAGDVLLTHKGNQLGRTAILDGVDWAVLTPQVTYYRIKDKSKIDARFLMYLFQSPKFQHQFKRDAEQSTRPFVSISSQQRLYLQIPPIDEQHDIARILGSLDNKIELNRRMNETLAEMARTVFRSWFVDFDPVRAKADSLKPHGMDAATAKQFPDRFEPSALGPIPKGWRIVPLTQATELFSGGTPDTSQADFWGGDINWYSVKDCPPPGDIFVTSTEKTITALSATSSRSRGEVQQAFLGRPDFQLCQAGT